MTDFKKYNINPYFDDFDEFKNFHQILFKPSFAVQGRELTQMQTIIRDQIKKFGDHVFKHGSVVIPGASNSDLRVPYIKIDSTINDEDINLSDFPVETVVVGQTTGIRAVIKKTVSATEEDPITFYVSYLSGAADDSAATTFAPGEIIESEDSTNITAKLIDSNATGVGSLAYINSGVYYINGTFVSIDSQSIILEKYTSTPSCNVLLEIKEEIISHFDDETLLDPAYGSYNYAAPGADRVKISLSLAQLPLDAEISQNYVFLMRFNEGILEEHNRYPKYSELEKSLARRTYDESGDYVVSGFSTTKKEHYKTFLNDGVYTEEDGGDKTLFVMDIDPGKAYINGFEIETLSNTRLSLEKARTTKDAPFLSTAKWGQYILVTNLTKLPDFRKRELVNIYDATSGGSNIGTLRVVAIDYFKGDPSSATAIYKLYFHDLTLNTPKLLSRTGRLAFANGGKADIIFKCSLRNNEGNFVSGEIITAGARAATVHLYDKNTASLYVYKHSPSNDLPIEGDYITGTTSSATIINIQKSVIEGGAPLIKIDINELKTLRNTENNYNIDYTAWKYVTIPTGQNSVTITDGDFVSPEAGTIVAFDSDGIVPWDDFTLSSPNVLEHTPGSATSTIYILTQVRKTLTPKTKTVETLTMTGISIEQEIDLDRTDIIRIVSIITDENEDITTYYNLDNGQRDFFYARGKITTKRVLPATASTVDIEFEYFSHSGSGDFFCVDSYTNLGAEYHRLIPSFNTNTSSETFNLINYLDFRPSMNSSGTFESGSSLSDFPVIDTLITTDTQYFVPRIDKLVIDKNAKIFAITGTPDNNPRPPTAPANTISLFDVSVPAYTHSLSDVIVTETKNRRYTMKDINEVSDRLNRLEQYSMITASENAILSYEIKDAATGTNRFKSGYMVDDFSNPFAICDYFNDDNIVNLGDNKCAPLTESFECDFLMVNTKESGNYNLTNGIQLSLPYTSEVLVKQPFSSRVHNLNPYLVVTCKGIMKLTPNSDNWTETKFLNEIIINTTTVNNILVSSRTNIAAGQAGYVSNTPIIIPINRQSTAGTSATEVETVRKKNMPVTETIAPKVISLTDTINNTVILGSDVGIVINETIPAITPELEMIEVNNSWKQETLPQTAKIDLKEK